MVAPRSFSTLWLTMDKINVPTSYTSHACFTFAWELFLTHPMLASLKKKKKKKKNLGSFSWTSRAGFIFMWGVSLTHPVLASFFLFYLGSFTYTSCAGFIFIRRVSLTHLMLALFLCGEFLLHVSFFLSFFFFFSLSLFFNLESFSCTSRAALIFMQGVSLTHPALASFLSGEFLLHITR